MTSTSLLLTPLGPSPTGCGLTPLGIGPEEGPGTPGMSPASDTPHFVLHGADRDLLHVATVARAGDHLERSEGDRFVVTILAIGGWKRLR